MPTDGLENIITDIPYVLNLIQQLNRNIFGLLYINLRDLLIGSVQQNYTTPVVETVTLV
jgi:hypothetical protein